MIDEQRLEYLLTSSRNRTAISGTTKVRKTKSEETIRLLNLIEGVEAEQKTTDEFDIPPTAIINIKVDLLEIL